MDDGGSIGPGLLEAEDLICSSGDLDEDEAVSAAWRSLSPAGGVGELGEVWPSLVVHAIHPIFINWGEGHRDNRSGVARLMLPVIFSQAYANKIFSPVSWEENFIWAAFTLPIRSQKKPTICQKNWHPHTYRKQAVEYGVCGRLDSLQAKTRLLLLLKGLWGQNLFRPTHPKYRLDLL